MAVHVEERRPRCCHSHGFPSFFCYSSFPSSFLLLLLRKVSSAFCNPLFFWIDGASSLPLLCLHSSRNSKLVFSLRCSWEFPSGETSNLIEDFCDFFACCRKLFFAAGKLGSKSNIPVVDVAGIGALGHSFLCRTPAFYGVLALLLWSRSSNQRQTNFCSRKDRSLQQHHVITRTHSISLLHLSSAKVCGIIEDWRNSRAGKWILLLACCLICSSCSLDSSCMSTVDCFLMFLGFSLHVVDCFLILFLSYQIEDCRFYLKEK